MNDSLREALHHAKNDPESLASLARQEAAKAERAYAILYAVLTSIGRPVAITTPEPIMPADGMIQWERESEKMIWVSAYKKEA